MSYSYIVYCIIHDELNDSSFTLINKELQDIFTFSCEYGCLYATEWLYNYAIEKDIELNININEEQPFRTACQYGHKDIAEWLYNLSKNYGRKIDINAMNDYAFSACENGFEHVAKWLYDLSKTDGNTKININVWSDYAFIFSCSSGYINIAKWLYDLSQIDDNNAINIRENNDVAFKYTCQHNQKEVAEWLCTLNDAYNIIYDTNQIIPKISNVRSILLDNDIDKITKEIKKTIDISKSDDVCMVCLENSAPLWIILDCGHELCKECFLNIDKCPFRCKNFIDQSKVKLINNNFGYDNSDKVFYL